MKKRQLIFQTYQQVEKFKNTLDNGESGTDEKINNIKNLENQLYSPECKIAVVGEFKRGKSSFINAILGEKVLPEAVSPWTAVQTEVVFDETETAYVWTETDDRMQVGRDQLEGWLTKSNIQDQKARKARIGFPSSFLLDNEVTLVDTPGLNDHNDLDMRTFDIVRDTDILIWMLSNSSPFSETELNYVINLIRNSEVSSVIFVINKIDIVEDRERTVLIQTVIQRINDMTEDLPERKAFFFHGEIPVFGFSAKYAFKAREIHDSKLLWESGLPKFQKKIEEVIEEVYWKKQTIRVLEPLACQVENEINICDEKILLWNQKARLFDICSEDLCEMNNFFDEKMADQAKIIGSNCKRQLKSHQTALQSRFHQNIYSRGYGVLTSCCSEANNLGNSYRDMILPIVTDALMGLYNNGKTDFFSDFFVILEKCGLEKTEELLLDSNVLALDRYIPKFSFGVLDFPGLLLKRNPSARQEYLDNIVAQVLNRIADRWESGCSTWASDITQKMNAKGNELIQTHDMILKKSSQEYRDNSSQLIDSTFYKEIKDVLKEVMELKAFTEEVLL